MNTMRVLRPLGLFVLLYIAVTIVQRSTGEILSRHNYGFLLRSIGQLQLTSGQVRLIFHYKFQALPSNVTFQRLDCDEYINRTALQRRCLSFRQVTNTLVRMKADIVKLLLTRMQEIDELLVTLKQRPNRQPRSIFSWIGGGLADLFGLAKFKDIQNVRGLLQNVLDGTQKAVEMWKDKQGLFTRVTQLTNERFQNIERLLNLSRISILQENKRLTQLRNDFYGIYRIIASITRQVHLAIRHTQEVEALYLAIQQLNAGRLSHHLLSADALQKALNNMARQLRRTGSGLQLVHRDTSFYYDHANVGAAVHFSNDTYVLFIVLYAPVVSAAFKPPLTVWQLQIFPLKSPNFQHYYTLLASPLKYIAYNPQNPYYIATTDYFDLPRQTNNALSQYVDIHDVSLSLYSTDVRSCALALFQNSLADIKQLCGYHVILNFLPSSVHRISDDKLLLNNISSLVVSRPARRNVKPIINKSIHFSLPQVIYQIPCEALIHVLNLIVHSVEHCSTDDDLTDSLNITYPMNLPILRHYFNDDLLHDINSAIELNSSVYAELPPLVLERGEYLQNLAQEDQYTFDFSAAINASAADEKLYTSLSHLIWSKLINNQYLNTFQVSSAFHWISVLSLILSGLNLLFFFYLYIRYKSINYLLLSLPRAKSQIIYTLPPTTPTTVYSIREAWLAAQTTMTELWSIELLLILILLSIIVLAILYLLHSSVSRVRYHTFIRLDLQAEGHRKYERIVLMLQYPPHYYRFDIRSTDISIEESAYFPRLNWSRGIIVTEQHRSVPVELTSPLIICPFMVRRIRRILKTKYTATLVILTRDSHIADILPLPASAVVGQLLYPPTLSPSAP